MKAFFLLILFLLASNSWAETDESRSPAATSLVVNSPTMTSPQEEAEITQKVRSRAYPGGSDESDLKVQSSLQKPTRKISPTAEDSSETGAGQD